MTNGISRRDFLKIGAAGAATAVLAGCQSPRRYIVLEPYVRPPEEQLAGVATWYASTCRQCPAGCGLIARIMNGRAIKLEGNPEHPLNRGKLCARGQAGLQILYDPDRLPGPAQQAVRGSREFQPLSWNEALNILYTKVQAANSEVAVWGGSTMSGHLYDLFQRFTTAIGASDPVVFDLYTSFHGYHLLKNVSQQLFGRAELPIYDLGQADAIFSFGANFLGTWLSSTRYGIEYGRLRSQPLGKRGYLVQFEPRMSITGAKADRWVPLRPGSEAIVAQAIARLIADQSFGPAERVERARALAGEVDVSSVATTSDISVEELTQLARIFATTERVVAVPGSTLTGQDNAAEAVAAVQTLNLIAATTGQPGGLSLSPETPQPTFVRPTPSSFADAQHLIERMRAGDVQVLMVHGANPAYELPEEVGFIEALKQVPFVVSFSPIVDETSIEADLILPEHTYLESWGYEVTSPSFDLPVIGSQQPVVTPVFDTRSTGDVLLTIARSIPAATKALPWADEVAFLKETISQLPAGAAGGTGADVLWARFLQHGGWWPASAPVSALPSATPAKAIQITPTHFQGDEQEYPYFLHLYMSDLLSDGRGASQPWLQGSPDAMTTVSWQTWVELNPVTAQKLGVQEGDIVKVTSPHGEVEAPVYFYPAIHPDTVAIPLGQGHSDYGRYAQDRGSNAMRLVGAQPDVTGSNLTWATLRVKITRTGRKVALARFESSVGVTQGFINQGFPGE
jgi:anaerobic selenocysteine-containing dehydrogenase